MELFNINSNKVEIKDLIELEGIFYYPDKIDKELLLQAGFKKVVYSEYPPITSPYLQIKTVISNEEFEYKVSFELENIPLEEAKVLKLKQLSLWAAEQTRRCKINLKGFGVIDGGYNYITNAEALLNNYDLLPAKLFRMYDDSFKEVTREQLVLIKKAIEVAGIQIHQLKWDYERAIAEATGIEDVLKIEFTDVIEVNLTARVE